MSDSASRHPLTSVNTEIIAVTVYPDQARITRRGQIEVDASTAVLAIGTLPAVLQANSIQAYAQGTARVTLQKPYLETSSPLASSKDDKETLTKQLHQTENAFRHCKDTLSGLHHQQSFLETLAEQTATSFAQGLSQQTTQLEAVAQFLEFFDQSYQRLAEAIATQERLKQDLDLKLQQARQAVQKLEATSIKPQHRILLPIQVETPGSLELRLIYDVTQARWNPVYDVRLEKDQHSLQIDCIAEIQQNTGENWTHVDLKVSTAAPEQTPAIPDPSLLRIQPFLKKPEPERKRSPQREIKSRSRVLDETYRMLGALPGSEIPPAVAEEDVLGNTNLQPASAIIAFTAITPAEVPSDGQAHRVPVGQLQLDSQFTYIALPQRNSAPYLCAELTNPPDKWPLLPGTAYLFRAGGYVGEVTFNYVAPGESFQLSLGLDERVAIQRELVAKETRNEGQCVDLRAFRLSIHNPFPHAIDISVLEQIPVSPNEDIKINLVKADPPTSLDKTGQCQWSMPLAAQETRHLYYQYAVEHPADIPISGLDG